MAPRTGPTPGPLIPHLPRLTKSDMAAALSVALLLIPQCLAYAELAGVPAHVGLVAASIPPIVSGAFGSSAHLQTGPVALTALVTFGIVSGRAEPGTDDYVALAALLAVMVGAIRIVLAALRLGRAAYLMTPAVVLGFTTGAALVITSSQLPAMLGRPGGDDVLLGGIDALVKPHLWSAASIGLAALVAVVIIGGRRVAGRRFPGVLIALSASALLAKVGSATIDTVGEVPRVLPVPNPGALPWDAAPSLLVIALVVSVIDFAEPAAIARQNATTDGVQWDASRELGGQGIANLASGLVGGFPVGGSFSRTSLNRLAGGRTRWSGIGAGLIVLALLPAAPLLSMIPRSALAATVVVAVYRLIDIPGVWQLLRSSPTQGTVALATAILTVALEPKVHIAVAVAVLASGVVAILTPAGRPQPDQDGGSNR